MFFTGIPLKQYWALGKIILPFILILAIVFPAKEPPPLAERWMCAQQRADRPVRSKRPAVAQ